MFGRNKAESQTQLSRRRVIVPLTGQHYLIVNNYDSLALPRANTTTNHGTK
jgi:hypothetical protein